MVAHYTECRDRINLPRVSEAPSADEPSLGRCSSHVSFVGSRFNFTVATRLLGENLGTPSLAGSALRRSVFVLRTVEYRKCFGAEQRRRLPSALKKCERPSVSCSRDRFVVRPTSVDTCRLVDDDFSLSDMGDGSSAGDGQLAKSAYGSQFDPTFADRQSNVSDRYFNRSAANSDTEEFPSGSSGKLDTSLHGFTSDSSHISATRGGKVSDVCAGTVAATKSSFSVFRGVRCRLRSFATDCMSRQTRGPRRSDGVKKRLRPSMRPRGCRQKLGRPGPCRVEVVDAANSGGDGSRSLEHGERLSSRTPETVILSLQQHYREICTAAITNRNIDTAQNMASLKTVKIRILTKQQYTTIYLIFQPFFCISFSVLHSFTQFCFLYISIFGTSRQDVLPVKTNTLAPLISRSRVFIRKITMS